MNESSVFGILMLNLLSSIKENKENNVEKVLNAASEIRINKKKMKKT